MAHYVDGFVIPIPKKNVAAYRRMARLGAEVWTDHGALQYFECAGDDLNVSMGRTFPRQLKLKRGETVILAWIVFKSRAHRDRVNANVMKDKRLAAMGDMKKMPFDMRRVLYGGFGVLVEAGVRPGSRQPRERRR